MADYYLVFKTFSCMISTSILLLKSIAQKDLFWPSAMILKDARVTHDICSFVLCEHVLEGV